MQSIFLEYTLRLIGAKESGDRKLMRLDPATAENATPSWSMRDTYDVELQDRQGCPVYSVSRRSNSQPLVVLFLHGGAYFDGFSSDHWKFIQELVAEVGCTVLAPDYPRLPLHNVDDVFAVVLPLLETLIERDVGPSNLVLIGDSAGGGLCLALAQALRDKGIPQPSQLFLLSPWLDATMTSVEIGSALDRSDPMLSLGGTIHAGRAYASTIGTHDPRVSPIYGSMRDLGPVSLFVGSHELFVTDCRKLKANAAKAGVEIDYHEYNGMIHDWMMMSLPESRRARCEIIASIQRGHILD